MNEYLSYSLLRTQDFYLVPLCLLILYIFGNTLKKKYVNHALRPYIMPALTLRFFFAVIYTLVMAYYYGYGDSHNYYQGVLDLHKAVVNDGSFLKDIYTKLRVEPTDRIYPFFEFDGYGVTHYYMLEPRNYMVARFALPFSLIFNKSFLCISFCISYFSFLGSWRICLMFYELYPHLYRKIAYATLFLPSLLFWGVSLLKDPICLGAMGFFIYASYSAFIAARKIPGSLLMMFLSGYLVFYTKPYILICVVAVFSLWIFLRLRDKIRDSTLRRLSTGFFFALAAAAGFYSSQSLAQSEMTAQYSTEELLKTVESNQVNFQNISEQTGSGSNFAVNEIVAGGSVLNLVVALPLGFVNTFFRPFPWDISSPLMLFSAVESFMFLSLTIICLRKIGLGKTINIIFSNPVIAFCFVFAILFGSIIGITTTNFGALARYKIPCISFYAMTLILIMDRSGKFSPRYIFSKRFF